jgi:hypothetical protein
MTCAQDTLRISRLWHRLIVRTSESSVQLDDDCGGGLGLHMNTIGMNGAASGSMLMSAPQVHIVSRH